MIQFLASLCVTCLLFVAVQASPPPPYPARYPGDQSPDMAEVGDTAVQNDLPLHKNAPNYSTFGLAPADASTADGPIVYSVTFNDPGSAYSAYYSAITSNLQAAGAEWARYVIGSGNLEVEVVMTSSVPRMTGGSVTSGFVRNDGTRDIFEQGAAYEIRTGIDPNGATPDIRITINPTYLTTNMWFDPQPSQRTDPIPPNRTDAISLFSHELGHAFVFNGWMNGTTGALPPTYMSPFDEKVAFDGNNFFFLGPNAQAFFGGPVAVTFGNPFHLGNNPPRPGADLIPDLMNGIVFTFQTRYRISALDVEISKDSGVAVTQYLQILSATKAGNQFLLQGVGVPTAPHRVKATDDLAQPFGVIGSVTADGNGNFLFPAALEPGVTKRFYQVVYP